MSLTKLGSELLGEILSNLEEPREIFPLLLVSQSFYKVAKPLLYREVRVIGKREAWEPRGGGRGGCRRCPTRKLEWGREFIRNLTFEGDEPEYCHDDIENLWLHFDESEFEPACLEEQTIQNVLLGEELDIEGMFLRFRRLALRFS